MSTATDSPAEDYEEFLKWKDSHTLGEAPPQCLTWTRYLDAGFQPHQEFQVSTAEGLRLAALGYRMYRYIQKETRMGRIPIMNPFKKSNAGPRMGVPVGGFGSGTIGRGWRGDFGRNYLFQGFPNYNIVDINAFSVSVSSNPDGSDGSGSVMTFGKPDNNKELHKCWRYNLKGNSSYYQGLYPRAWTTYEEDESVKMVCRQMSPVIPHNYKETSYPVGTFKWTLYNNSSSTKYVNIMFSFLNGTGDANDATGGHFNRVFQRDTESGKMTGIAMHHKVIPNERNQRILKDVGKTDGQKGMALKMIQAKGGEKDDDGDAEEKEDTEYQKTLRKGFSGGKDPLTMAIAVLADGEDEVSFENCFQMNDKKTLRDIWEKFETSTKLSGNGPGVSHPSTKGQEIASCLMIRVSVPAGGKRSVSFALGWDMPIVRFNAGTGYYRRYTKFFGRDGNEIEKIVAEALEKESEWEQKIEDWQNSILSDKNLPSWYKQALFNELYYLAEGGSVWTDGEVGKESAGCSGNEDIPSSFSTSMPSGVGGSAPPNPAMSSSAPAFQEKSETSVGEDGDAMPAKKHRMTVSMDLPVNSQLLPFGGDINPALSLNYSKQVNEALCKGEDPSVDVDRYAEIVEEDAEENDEDAYESLGKFGYLESMEYLMVNTYDVHFYASWALIQLWPLLDLTIQRDFAHSTLYDDYSIVWKTLHSGKKARRKVQYAVPHDLGNPGDDPWYRVNSYNIQEINSWKDLNCKFALQVYRDYLLTKNRQFLFSCWTAVEHALRYIQKFDKDGDGLIENEGFPDQTYDTWSALGASAYSGGLWLAALSAAAAMCREMELERKATQYDEKLKKAKKAYHDKLWNGTYFNYDTSANPQHDSIMTDMCCGQWWARACGLPPLDGPECFQSSLSTIYNFNVKKFRNGEAGPINGMRPDGKLDTTCMQSVEVWTGTAYGAASAMMQEGLVKEGFETAKGIVTVTYDTIGYMYQTPEAWDTQCHYRAIGYMRPLAIWGMQYAWEHIVPQELKDQMGDGTITTIEERGLANMPKKSGGDSSRKIRKDVVKWCQTELKLPEDVAEDYEARLASPPLGVACVDDLRWLLEEDMDLLDFTILHKRKIMAWVNKNKP
jgi:non-lysosomal glucosylceramidase